MAVYVFKNGYFKLGSDALTAYSRVITLNVMDDAPEATAHGETTRTRMPDGMKDWNFDVEMNQESEAVDAKLWAARGQSTAIEVGPKGATPADATPVFKGNAIMTSYGPVAGTVGDPAIVSAHFEANGALERDTTP